MIFIFRIPIGFSTHSSFMLRLMQLKYPYFPTKMSLSHAEVNHGANNCRRA